MEGFGLEYYSWDKATGEVKRLPGVMEWGDRHEIADRRVAKDEVGDVVVYTSFLGIDHNWSAGPPLLFETMCTVSGKWSDLQIRYETAAEALETHRDLLEHLSVGGTPDDFEKE